MRLAPISPQEPTQSLAQRPVLKLLLATRPAFLTITLVAVLLGLAGAWHDQGRIDLVLALVTLLFAMCAHAGANVINDYHDVETDALNHERVFPFTGGSRFIQNGVLSRRATGWLGYLLLALVMPAGIWLAWRSGIVLIAIGLFGLLAAGSYSAPPLRFSARGMGEAAITLAWALVVIGSDYVQRASMAPASIAIGIAYGLMVANLLYINQFPDAVADGLAGKRTWVVRLGPQRAVPGYAVIAAAAAMTLTAAVTLGSVNPCLLWALLAMPLSGMAYHDLRCYSAEPTRLGAAIRRTILATHIFGLLMVGALLIT